MSTFGGYFKKHYGDRRGQMFAVRSYKLSIAFQRNLRKITSSHGVRLFLQYQTTRNHLRTVLELVKSPTCILMMIFFYI